MTASLSAPKSLTSWLGEEAESLLLYQAKYSKEKLHLPGKDFVSRIFALERSLRACFQQTTKCLLSADHEVPAFSRPRLSKNPTILLSRKQFFTPHFKMGER